MIEFEKLKDLKEGDICFYGTGAYIFIEFDSLTQKVDLITHGAFMDCSVSLSHFLSDFRL